MPQESEKINCVNNQNGVCHGLEMCRGVVNLISPDHPDPLVRRGRRLAQDVLDNGVTFSPNGYCEAPSQNEAERCNAYFGPTTLDSSSSV